MTKCKRRTGRIIKNGQIRENYLEKEQKTKSYLLENASGELGDFLKELEEERKKESKKSKGKA